MHLEECKPKKSTAMNSKTKKKKRSENKRKNEKLFNYCNKSKKKFLLRHLQVEVDRYQTRGQRRMKTRMLKRVMSYL